MKKILLLAIAAVAVSSCATTSATLINSATTRQVDIQSPVACIFADVDVSPKRITYFMTPSRTVLAGGYDNVINSAVREALDANGSWDILVAMETQVKYNKDGEIESVTVSGYPARYVNFRSPGDEYLKSLPVNKEQPETGVKMNLFKKK